MEGAGQGKGQVQGKTGGNRILPFRDRCETRVG